MSLRLSLRYGEVCVPLLAASLAVLSTGCSDTTEPVARPELLPPGPVAVASDISGKSVLPDMDTYVNSDVANRNYGSHDTLLIQKNPGKSANRILVSFPQGGITDSLGADSLVSATLELTIKSAGNDWGTSGGAVVLHRMTRDWLESGATWNCANDVNVGNLKADCPGNTWSMPGTTPPFLTTPVAQSVITSGQSGVVSFDVTSDVRAFLAGQAQNQGWLLKLAAESQTGTVIFHSREGATRPRLVLSTSGDEPVPDQAPATLPSWVYASTNLDSNTTALPGVFLKEIVIVEFKPSATQSQRQAAVDLVGGSVIGGVPSSAGEGHYYLQITDSTRGAGLVSAVQQLESLPQVQLATYEFDVAPMFRRPADNATWSSWHIDRKSLSSENWALEAVLAPMAWGCSTGDSTLKVAVVDYGLPSLPPGHDLAMTIHPAPGGINPAPREHGIGVASVLAARGNNNQGMTGMMWHADLHGYDTGELGNQEHAFVGRVFQQIKNAADDGARIVNVSLAVLPHWPDSTRARAGRGLDSTLSALGARGKRPLVVLAAGNFTSDAATAGFPRAVTGRNGAQIIVVAASTKDSVLMTRPIPQGFGSNYGPLITVAAPGAAVYQLKRSGAIEPEYGTSVAAPIVTGIAGLLLSFDDRLQATDLKSLIVDGANAGGWKATRVPGDQYPIVNAYESLKLAAQRSGAPLCGNRVWAQDGGIYAERGGTDVLLFSPGPAGFLNVFHDGRRIDWLDNDYETVHSAVLSGTTWAEVADRAGLTDTAPSGTYLSFGPLENDFWYSANHDNDTLIRVQQFHNVADNDVRVQTSADNGATWTQILAFHEPGADLTTTEYVVRKAVFATDGSTFIEWKNTDSVGAGPFRNANVDISYYPEGSKALLKVNVGQITRTMLSDFEKCPWASENNGVNTEECRNVRLESVTYETRLKELDLKTGAQRTLLTVPGFLIGSGGVSEAGDEAIILRQRRRSGYDTVPRTDGVPGYTFTNTHSTQFECQASWHSLKTPSGPPLRVVQGAQLCETVSVDGGGTIAPSVGRVPGGISLDSGLRP
jgi:subtilase family protein